MERDVNLFITGLFGLAIAILLFTHLSEVTQAIQGTATASNTFLGAVKGV